MELSVLCVSLLLSREVGSVKSSWDHDHDCAPTTCNSNKWVAVSEQRRNIKSMCELILLLKVVAGGPASLVSCCQRTAHSSRLSAGPASRRSLLLLVMVVHVRVRVFVVVSCTYLFVRRKEL